LAALTGAGLTGADLATGVAGGFFGAEAAGRLVAAAAGLSCALPLVLAAVLLAVLRVAIASSIGRRPLQHGRARSI